MSTPTGRAWTLLVAGSLLVVAGFAWTPLALLGLCFDALVLALLWADGRRARAWQVALSRQLPAPLFQGEQTELGWTVENQEARPLVVQLREVLHPSLSAEPLSTTLVVGPRARRQHHQQLVPRHRGPVTLPPASLRVQGPWGLAWGVIEQLPGEQTRVLPRMHLTGKAALLLQRALRNQGATRARRYQGVATELAGVREYQSGDEYRRIHWKASARYRRPVTRELDWSQHQHVVILLDCGRPMAGLAGEMSKLDHAMSAVIALTRVVLAQGDAATLVLFSDQVRRVVRVDKRTRGVQTVVEALHAEQADRGEPDYADVVAWVARQVPRRSVALLVTSVVDLHTADRVVEAVTGLSRRHRPLLVDLVDPGLAQVLSTEPEDVEDAYALTSALALEQQNQLLQARLQAQGVACLSTPAEGLAAGMLSRYLQLKARRG